MIRRMIGSNRIKHQKNIFKLSKSKKQYNENLVNNQNQNKESDNKKSEFNYSHR